MQMLTFMVQGCDLEKSNRPQANGCQFKQKPLEYGLLEIVQLLILKKKLEVALHPEEK